MFVRTLSCLSGERSISFEPQRRIMGYLEIIEVMSCLSKNILPWKYDTNFWSEAREPVFSTCFTGFRVWITVHWSVNNFVSFEIRDISKSLKTRKFLKVEQHYWSFQNFVAVKKLNRNIFFHFLDIFNVRSSKVVINANLKQCFYFLPDTSYTVKRVQLNINIL